MPSDYIRPLQRIDEITERQDAIAALHAVPEVRSTLMPILRQTADLERLLARVHAFSLAQASNVATHYEDVGKVLIAA